MEKLEDNNFNEKERELLAEEIGELSDEALDGIAGGGSPQGRCPNCGFVFFGTASEFQDHINRCQV